jgi:hypothetical protein
LFLVSKSKNIHGGFLMGRKGWTDWADLAPFTNHFEIRPYVGHAAAKRHWNTTLEGVSGHLSRAEGLWPVDGGAFDFTDIDVSKIPVGIYFIRIKGGEDHHPSGFFDYIGLANPQTADRPNRFQVGIFQRAYEHYRKIVGIPHRRKIGEYIREGFPDLHERSQRIEKFKDQNFSNYEDLRDFFIKCNKENKVRDIPEKFRQLTAICSDELKTFESIKEFFATKVSFSYNLYSGVNAKTHIENGEALAILTYKNKYGEIPYLNGTQPYLNDANLLESIEGFNKII